MKPIFVAKNSGECQRAHNCDLKIVGVSCGQIAAVNFQEPLLCNPVFIDCLKTCNLNDG